MAGVGNEDSMAEDCMQQNLQLSRLSSIPKNDPIGMRVVEPLVWNGAILEEIN